MVRLNLFLCLEGLEVLLETLKCQTQNVNLLSGRKTQLVFIAILNKIVEPISENETLKV